MKKLVLLAVLVVPAWLAWVYETRFPVRSPQAPPQTLVVAPGASVAQIARQLHEQGLVRHPLIFRALALRRGVAGRLRAGEYLFAGPLTLEQVLDKIARGEVVRHDLTFPEGKNLEEMAEIAAAAGIPAASFLSAARDPTSIRDLDPRAEDLEGYLFPDTYELPKGPEAGAVLVGRMVKRFRAVMDPEMEKVKASGRTLREVVTLASVVELETARPEERPRVAAVFANRLQKRMPLQTDPTVIYALRKAGTWNGNIRKDDLAVDSPYNTYRYPGLPPGPIANPGRESLRAVLSPAPVNDVYFVSRNDGSHYFSDTLEEHQRAVDHYQRGRGPAPPPR